MDIIIYPPTINWSFMKQRPQQLMKQFAEKGYRVYYCNMTQSNKEIEEISTNLYLVHNHERWLKEELPNMRNQIKGKVGVWCSWAKLATTLSQYNPDWIIYDCVDEFVDWLKYEPEMIRVADAIVCTAERLEKRLRRAHPDKNVYLIRNAYDQEMNLHQIEDNNLEDKQVVGYIGAWAPWLDEKLIGKLASSMTDINIVVIGAEFGKRFNLHHIPNITFLGHKKHEELKQYIKKFSVCIIPFHVNQVTLATNPVKMYEYLATGKPVVSTNLPECFLCEHVDVASNHMEFINTVKKRLRDPGESKYRIDFALQNTWSDRADEAIRIIKKIGDVE
ncbi:MAG: glycosyltransferase [Bacillaceae bacterium]|nr:glycosyltransferase [Bacillaceae bacterium]